MTEQKHRNAAYFDFSINDVCYLLWNTGSTQVSEGRFSRLAMIQTGGVPSKDMSHYVL